VNIDSSCFKHEEEVEERPFMAATGKKKAHFLSAEGSRATECSAQKEDQY